MRKFRVYVFQAAIYTFHLEREEWNPQSPAQLIQFMDKLVRNRFSTLTRRWVTHFDKAMSKWFQSRE